MPLYDLKCATCGRLKLQDYLLDEPLASGQKVTLPCQCSCGGDTFTKDGIGVPADNSRQWEKFRKGIKRVHGTSRPVDKDPERPRPWEKK